MSKQKFTHGTHVAVAFYQEIDARSKDNPTQIIQHPCHHVECNGEITADCIENIYDATLYAASPDMYRALRGVYDLLAFDDEYMHSEEVKAAEAALAKADGE